MLKEGSYNVRYYRQENQGESASRNKLVELAEGKYITFIDSDDLLFPYALEELYKPIQIYGDDVITYSGYTGIDADGNETPRKQIPLPSGNIVTELFEYIYVHSCGTLCTKKLLQEAGDFDISLPVCSPYIIWLKLALNHKFIAIEKPTFKRRRHSSNLSQRSYANVKIELDVLEDFYYNGGGKAVIPESRAMKRLAKEGYRAGKCALCERKFETAAELLKVSLNRKFTIKSLAYYLYAAVR
jgi:glycosyltransferase involved in cell wall biosynthesis